MELGTPQTFATATQSWLRDRLKVQRPWFESGSTANPTQGQLLLHQLQFSPICKMGIKIIQIWPPHPQIRDLRIWSKGKVKVSHFNPRQKGKPIPPQNNWKSLLVASRRLSDDQETASEAPQKALPVFTKKAFVRPSLKPSEGWTPKVGLITWSQVIIWTRLASQQHHLDSIIRSFYHP